MTICSGCSRLIVENTHLSLYRQEGVSTDGGMWMATTLGQFCSLGCVATWAIEQEAAPA